MLKEIRPIQIDSLTRTGERERHINKKKICSDLNMHTYALRLTAPHFISHSPTLFVYKLKLAFVTACPKARGYANDGGGFPCMET